MATVTGFTAERMQQIEDSAITGGAVGPTGSPAGHLILARHDGTLIDAGSVIGPTGAVGPAGPLAVGTHAARPSSPTQGQAYFETDTKKLFLCYTAGAWVLFSTEQAWTAITGGVGYTNSWTDFGTGYAGVGYKLSETKVLLRGAMKGPTVGVATAGAAFTLPAGYRPPANTSVTFPVVNNNSSYCAAAFATITAAGVLTISYGTGGNSNYIAFDGCSFDTV